MYYDRFSLAIESIHRIPLFIHVGANISVLSILGFQVIIYIYVLYIHLFDNYTLILIIVRIIKI